MKLPPSCSASVASLAEPPSPGSRFQRRNSTDTVGRDDWGRKTPNEEHEKNECCGSPLAPRAGVLTCQPAQISVDPVHRRRGEHRKSAPKRHRRSHTGSLTPPCTPALVVFQPPRELSVKFNQIVRGKPKDGENGRLQRIRFAELDPPTCRIGNLGICRLPGEILALRPGPRQHPAPLFLRLVLDRPERSQPGPHALDQLARVPGALVRRHLR